MERKPKEFDPDVGTPVPSFQADLHVAEGEEGSSIQVPEPPEAGCHFAMHEHPNDLDCGRMGDETHVQPDPELDLVVLKFEGVGGDPVEPCEPDCGWISRI
jgi:hypothetical protein